MKMHADRQRCDRRTDAAHQVRNVTRAGDADGICDRHLNGTCRSGDLGHGDDALRIDFTVERDNQTRWKS